MTAKGSTKQEILDAALELFSVQGYEATSISQLAEAVGIRKASLYSHFENKQAILDALMQATLEQYEQHSIFAKADWDDPAFTKDKENMTPDMAVQLCLGQIRYILHDPQISRARRASALKNCFDGENDGSYEHKRYKGAACAARLPLFQIHGAELFDRCVGAGGYRRRSRA